MNFFSFVQIILEKNMDFLLRSAAPQSLQRRRHRRRHVIWRFQCDARFSDSKSNQPRPKAEGRASVVAYVTRFPSARESSGWFFPRFPLRGRPSLFDRDEARDMTNRAGEKKGKRKMGENVKARGRRQIVAQMRGDIWRYRYAKSLFLSPLSFSFLFRSEPANSPFICTLPLSLSFSFSLSCFASTSKTVNKRADIYHGMPITAVRENERFYWRFVSILGEASSGTCNKLACARYLEYIRARGRDIAQFAGRAADSENNN